MADSAAGAVADKPRLVVLDDADAVAREAARLTTEALAEAIQLRGHAHLALAGGSTAVPLYRELRSEGNRDRIDWAKVHLWWGDERFVPIDHPESNAGLAYRLLLAMPERAGQSGGSGGQSVDVAAGDVPALDIDPGNIHPVEVEETLSDDEPVELAAALYAREISRYVARGKGGLPIFDVMLTGVGPDGHILSLFPNSPGLAHDAATVIGVPAPKHVEPHIARVTLSARTLPMAGLVLVMTTGDAKSGVLAQVLGDDHDVARWPAQAALLPNAVWLLDSAASPQPAPGPTTT